MESCSMLNIDKVIAFLEAETTAFDMSSWMAAEDETNPSAINLCGTAACIGGTCDIVRTLNADGLTFNWNTAEDDSADMISWLTEGFNTSLDEYEISRFLFHPRVIDVAEFQSMPGEPGHITRPHAVAALRHFRDTGKIDWNVKW
jgi:hypothetical protein